VRTPGGGSTGLPEKYLDQILRRFLHMEAGSSPQGTGRAAVVDNHVRAPRLWSSWSEHGRSRGLSGTIPRPLRIHRGVQVPLVSASRSDDNTSPGDGVEGPRTVKCGKSFAQRLSPHCFGSESPTSDPGDRSPSKKAPDVRFPGKARSLLQGKTKTGFGVLFFFLFDRTVTWGGGTNTDDQFRFIRPGWTACFPRQRRLPGEFR